MEKRGKGRVATIIWFILGLAFIYFYIRTYGAQAFFQQLVNGLQIGSIYALISLGYSMVYGIIRLINFAHGDLFMFGAYIAYFAGNFFLFRKLTFSFLPTLFVAMGSTALLGIVIERIAYRPLRYKPRLSALITALGVSLFLENFFSLPSRGVPFPLNYLVFGPEFRAFPALIEDRVYTLWGVTLSTVKIIDFLVAILLMLALHFIVHRTKVGKAMRAVSFNKDVARLMGININRTIAYTFGLGTSLAAASGTLFALTYGSLQSPYLGVWPGLKAFVAAVLGGIGSIPGAMLGGFLMGVSETFATSINSNLGYGVAFIILILVLLLKPTGLLGRPTIEKV